MLLCATNSQSLEEQSIRFVQKVLGTGLGELGQHLFLGEVKEYSRFFLTDTCLFCKKSSTIILMSYRCFYSSKLSWQTTLLTRDDKALTSSFCLQNIQNYYKICSWRMQQKRFRGCIFPPKSTSICHLVENLLPFYCVLRLYTFNFVIIFHRKKSSINFYEL